ncbi:MAG: hypothetical protein HKP27_07960 [Myxococcales bacterium]|nr:hypothetical protein [Myxococcales bacterium]
MGDRPVSLKRELEELRRVRDELRLHHLGGMEAHDLWDDLEARFDGVEARAKQLANASGDALNDLGGSLRENIAELGQGYSRLRELLASKVSAERLWDRLRHTFERVVDEGYKATERVVGSIEELGDAARLRVEKARIERDLLKKCAKLGARVYEVAREPGLPDGTPPQVLEDERVKALLLEVGSLNSDLKKAVTELSPEVEPS